MTTPEITLIPLEEFKEMAGRKLFTSPWIEITQEDVDIFADVTDDHQWLHVDPQQAVKGPFGGTIAHGFLTLSLLTKMSSHKNILPRGTTMAINYGFNSIRFLAPVHVGKRIRDRAGFISIEEKDNGKILVNTRHTIEIEGEAKPALVAEWLFMYFVTQ